MGLFCQRIFCESCVIQTLTNCRETDKATRGLKHFYGDNDCAFDPHHGYIVVRLEKALQRYFSCMVVLFEKEMHCINSPCSTETGLNTKLFYLVHPIKGFALTAG